MDDPVQCCMSARCGRGLLPGKAAEAATIFVGSFDRRYSDQQPQVLPNARSCGEDNDSATRPLKLKPNIASPSAYTPTGTSASGPMINPEHRHGKGPPIETRRARSAHDTTNPIITNEVPRARSVRGLAIWRSHRHVNRKEMQRR